MTDKELMTLAIKARENAEKKHFGEFNREKEHLYNVGAGVKE